MIVDYYVVRRCQLDVDGLYLRNGPYTYSSGTNWRAIAALAIGIAGALLGLWFEPLRWLYDYAWFIGFFISGTVYLLLMRGQ